MSKTELFLPDFIIIGANKSGTTSVANYLNMHRDIQMSRVKEPMFFSTVPSYASASLGEESLVKPYFTLTLEEYSQMFSDTKGKRVKHGEASTSYLANPFISSKLIRKVVPNVKIIAILRDPTERAISAYKMCYGNGIEKRAFSQIVEEATDQMTILVSQGVEEYIRNGLYAQLLDEYLCYFDSSQLLILNYDELCSNPAEFMSKITNFIGVGHCVFDFSKRYNTESDHLSKKIKIDDDDIKMLKKIYLKENKDLMKIVPINIDRWLYFDK